jgi:hypothetical protein
MFGAISRPRLGACQRSWARVRRRRTGAPRIRMIAPSRHPPTADAGAAGAREVCSIAPLPTRATSMSATLLHPHRFDGTRVTSNCGRLLRTTSSAPSETGSRPSRLIETGSMPPRQSLRGATPAGDAGNPPRPSRNPLRFSWFLLADSPGCPWPPACSSSMAIRSPIENASESPISSAFTGGHARDSPRSRPGQAMRC